ncbi:MAG TPA: T9SS type A sorting domain-containing protein [Flavobacterium sp.]|jgi:uncharacterized repeat protein (TIGR01451 family)
MKKIYLLTSLIVCIAAEAQTITFPDPNLKAKLLEASAENGIALDINQNYIDIDTNNDNEIQVSEAINVYHLLIYSGDISSLAGIENFPNVRTLDCSFNALTSLDVSGLPNLQDLTCSMNQLTSLDVSGKTTLQYLICNNNMLTTLNVSGCTSMVHLEFPYNQVSSVELTGMNNLATIIANDNNLTSIDVSNFSALDYIDCSYNNLTNLNLTGCTALVYLNCTNNQLTTLDLSSSHPEIADCDTNQITSLIIKNGFDDSEGLIDFGENPLIYLCVDEVELETYQEILDFYGYDAEINTYCSFAPGGTYYTVIGNNSFDITGDGCDSNDIAFPNLRFNIMGNASTGIYVANGSGSYSVPLPEGTHTLTPVMENPAYFQVSPESVSVSFPADISPFNQPFCISANGVHPDLEVIVVPMDAAVPGFEAAYKIIYRNKGNQVMAGTISLTFENDVMQMVSAAPEATASGNMLTWNFSEMNPTNTREIDLLFHLNAPTDTPPANLDDELTFTAQISADADEDPSDNTYELTDIVVGSFDPNDITCLEGDSITPEMVGDYVYYRVRFENTGTFPAQNIVVRNFIDTTKLNLASLVPINSGHNFSTRITGNKVEFIFENINLPFDDANNDGYILYKIRTNGNLVVGNSFSNEASIYFDYNFPVETVPAVTTVQALGVQDFNFADYFTLYPNPAANSLNIASADGISVKTINIYNILGQVVLAIPDAQAVSVIDVSDLKNGQYFIKITSDKGTSAAKFIKQ